MSIKSAPRPNPSEDSPKATGNWAAAAYDPAGEDLDYKQRLDERAARAVELSAKVAMSDDVPDRFDDAALSEFPVAALPTALRNFAVGLSVFQQVPVSMACMYVLQACSIAAAHLDVMIQDGGGLSWGGPCVIQSLVTAAPSMRKSPCQSAAMRPIWQWVKNDKERYQRERDKVTDELERYLASQGFELGKTKSGHVSLDNLDKSISPEQATTIAQFRAQLAAIKPAGERPQSDITPEAFVRKQAKGSGMLALMSDEGDCFQPFAGRYNAGQANLKPLLNGWDGSPTNYVRVGGGKEEGSPDLFVESPRVPIAVTAQYAVLAELTQPKSVFRSKGMLARMLFYCAPARRTIPNPHPMMIPMSVAEAYSGAVLQLFEARGTVRMRGGMPSENGWCLPPWFEALRQRVAIGQMSGGEFEGMEDWAEKSLTNIARVACVLEAMGGGGADNLTALYQFFVSHAERALQQPGSEAPATGTKTDLLTKIIGNLAKKYPPKPVPVAEGSPKIAVSDKFSLRDAKRASGRKSKTMTTEEFEILINTLLGTGHLHELPNSDKTSLGHGSIRRMFVLRQELIGGVAPQAAAEPESVASAHDLGDDADDFDRSL